MEYDIKQMNDVFENLSFFKRIEWTYRRFEKAKVAYLEDRNPQTIIELQQTYDLARNDLKAAWVDGLIPRHRFFELDEVLKEGTV